MFRELFLSTMAVVLKFLWQSFLTAFVVRSYYMWFGYPLTNMVFTIWPFWALVLSIRVIIHQPQSREDLELEKLQYAEREIKYSGYVNWVIYIIHNAIFLVAGFMAAILKLNY